MATGQKRDPSNEAISHEPTARGTQIVFDDLKTSGLGELMNKQRSFGEKERTPRRADPRHRTANAPPERARPRQFIVDIECGSPRDEPNLRSALKEQYREIDRRRAATDDGHVPAAEMFEIAVIRAM